MMRDGSKWRRIPSVHWGYSNLITCGCLENGITSSLQNRLPLWACDCPRSGRWHSLTLCGWVFFIVLRKVVSHATGQLSAAECFNCKIRLSVFFINYFSSPSRGVLIEFSAHNKCQVQLHDIEYSMPQGVTAEMGTAGGAESAWVSILFGNLLMSWRKPENWLLSSG